jgi:protein gp37
VAEHSTIEWTDATWNPITGCSVVSPGCTNCYAMGLAGTRLQHHPSRAGLTRPSKAGPVWNGVVRFNEEWLTQPLQWKRPRMIFVCAHGDLFHESVPDAWIDRVFAVMALAPQHTFQVLTKRSARMRAYCNDPGTPHRVAKAMDALTLAVTPVAEERVAAINGFPGYFVTDRGRILSDRGSAQCVHCGQPVERTARARYCSKRCRQNGQYRLRTGKPMLFPASLAEMSPDVGEDGHRRVMLYRDGQTVRELVHRLVLAAFDRPAVDGEQGRHRDGDPSNNALGNLSWGDQSANWDDRRRHGAFRSYAKLTHEQAAEIKRRFEAGETGAALGREFGISDTQARNIGDGQQWAVAAPIQWPLLNCWKGVSAEDQRRADERVPDLLATPAAVRFVSAEPLLGPIDFRRIEARSTGTLINGDFAHPKRIDALTGWAGHYPSPTVFHPRSHRLAALSWIIVGGESGPNARPMHPAWARSIRDQCTAAGVAYLFKQHGAWADVGPHPRGEWVASDPRSEDPIHDIAPVFMAPVGKKAAGRLLDGVEHNGMPEVRP